MTGPRDLEPRPEPKRDRWGRYLLPDPATGKERSWQRATTLAKFLSDTHGLTKWELRMAALGMALRPDLVAQAATVRDPDDPNAKRTLNDIAATAKEHAGSSTRARLGTALHSYCEQADLGMSPTVPEPYDRDVAAYSATMAAAGIKIDTAHIERIVLIPELEVCGTFDRLGLFERLQVGDIKTGRDLSYSWGEIAIQLALYAHASHVWDWDAEAWEPMPDVDQDEAWVAHVPAGEGKCKLYSVDIAAGWEAVERAVWVRDWRKRKNLAVPITLDLTPEAVAEAPVVDDPFAGFPATEDLTERREWVRGRVQAIVDAGHKDELAAQWPATVPTFGALKKQGGHHSADQLDAIAKICSKVEAAHVMPFADPDPATAPEPFLPSDDPELVDLAARVSRLPSDLLAECATIIKDAGIPRLLSGRVTRTQAAEARTHIDAAGEQYKARLKTCQAHLDMGRSLGVDADLLVSTASAGRTIAVGALTGFEAERLGELVDAIQAGLVKVEDDSLVVVDDGRKGWLQSARAICKEWGRPAPKSAAEVLADPVLVAAIAAQ